MSLSRIVEPPLARLRASLARYGRRGFAPALSSSSTRTERCPSDQGRFLRAVTKLACRWRGAAVLNDSSTRRVRLRPSRTKHPALQSDQPRRRVCIEPSSQSVRQPDRRKNGMSGPFVCRDKLFTLVDVALALLDIGFLRRQRLFAVVDLPDSRQQIA